MYLVNPARFKQKFSTFSLLTIRTVQPYCQSCQIPTSYVILLLDRTMKIIRKLKLYFEGN